MQLDTASHPVSQTLTNDMIHAVWSNTITNTSAHSYIGFIVFSFRSLQAFCEWAYVPVKAFVCTGGRYIGLGLKVRPKCIIVFLLLLLVYVIWWNLTVLLDYCRNYSFITHLRQTFSYTNNSHDHKASVKLFYCFVGSRSEFPSVISSLTTSIHQRTNTRTRTFVCIYKHAWLQHRLDSVVVTVFEWIWFYFCVYSLKLLSRNAYMQPAITTSAADTVVTWFTISREMQHMQARG